MSTEDEIFALKFELKTLADLTIRREAERWVPGLIWMNNEEEHLSRYRLAKHYVKNKRVLDIACGSGYGSYLLAEGEALSVTGYDLDQEAVRYGNIKFNRHNIQRAVKDALSPLSENEFDVVVSFETIEHLSNYEDFLTNIHKTLKQEGTLIISTPIVEHTRTNCVNPYHCIEWSFNDFQSLVTKYFSISEVFVQGLLYKEPRKNIIQRVTHKMRRILNLQEKSRTNVRTSLQPQEYKQNQYSIVEGYQILICKKS